MLTKGDKIFFIFLLLIAGSLFYAFYKPKNNFIKPKYIRIEKDGILYCRRSLANNKLIRLKTRVGEMIVQIKDNKVRILKSSCKNKLCVEQGWISRVGEKVICVPSKVVVIIEGENSDFDAVSK